MVATMLYDAQDKIAVFLEYATLEMALIVLLLWSGFFSYFNAKFAAYFKLKPLCIWCSMVDHVFDPRKLKASSRVLFCENHAIEVSRLGFCLSHKTLVERQSMCGDCLSFCKRTDQSQVEIGFVACSCCGASLGNQQDIIGKLVEIENCDGKRGNFIDDRVTEDAIKEAKLSKERETRVDSEKNTISLERRDSFGESLEGSIIRELETGEEIEKLRSELTSEREALQSLYAELDEERNASAVAASQTMAMINRLQEEKASMQMEALHYQRMMDEQADHDHEALQLLNELLLKREKEKAELQRELESRDELMKKTGCSCTIVDDRVYDLSFDDNSN